MARAPTEIHSGSVLELVIDGVTAAGEGVGRTGGRALFTAGALPGERVRVRVERVTARRVVARLDEVIEQSPDRVAPACPVFDRCGGCQLMHASYDAQLRLKRTILADTLRSVAGIEASPDLAVAPAEAPLGYRNRGQYPVARAGSRVVTGFFAPRSHRVVPVERCLLHPPEIDAAVGCVRAWAQRKKIPIYDESRHRGVLRHVVVRRGAGGLQLVLVVRREPAGGFGDLLRRLRRQVPDLTSLVLNLNPARTNVVLGRRNRTLWGDDRIEEELSGLRFRLSVGSFFQVHTAQAAVLFDKVAAFLGPPAGPVVDAYGGVGALGAVLASRGHEVCGIECVPQAVADARAAVAANQLAGVTLHEGRVERVLPRLVAAGLRPAAIVLDPPRKGCDQAVLDATRASGTPRIAYVSCHPGTLARDLDRLSARGFRLVHLEAVDMFPQTAHLEVLAGLEVAG